MYKAHRFTEELFNELGFKKDVNERGEEEDLTVEADHMQRKFHLTSEHQEDERRNLRKEKGIAAEQEKLKKEELKALREYVMNAIQSFDMLAKAKVRKHKAGGASEGNAEELVTSFKNDDGSYKPGLFGDLSRDEIQQSQATNKRLLGFLLCINLTSTQQV